MADTGTVKLLNEAYMIITDAGPAGNEAPDAFLR